MTNSEALEILQKEVSCRKEPEYKCNERTCTKCDYKVDEGILVGAMETAIEALELLACMENDGR